MFILGRALEAIKDKPEFKVYDRDTYVVIDYMLQKEDTFKGEHKDILVNLRGTAFDKSSGKIISLPFHKFHNLNECEGYMEKDIDLSKVESVMVKEDGSMIRPIPADGGFRLGTRAGVTDVAIAAEKWMVANLDRYGVYKGFIESIIDTHTPIFEYVGPSNKIVLDYSEHNLILLAIRRNEDGHYVDYHTMKQVMGYWKNEIPLVPLVEFGIGDVKHLENAEGVVVSLKDGFRFKVKSDWYVRRHRAKDLIRFNKDVISLILKNEIDDVLPLLSEEEVEAIRGYQNYLDICIYLTADWLEDQYRSMIIEGCKTKKEYALTIMNGDKKSFSSIMFGIWDGKDAYELIAKELINACSSSTKIDECLIKYSIKPFN